MSEAFSLQFLRKKDLKMSREEYILSLLWDHIKREESFFDDDDLIIIEENEPLTTRGDVTYWFDEVFSREPELAQAVAAFNALRGRIELVFQDEKQYQSAVEAEKIKERLEALQDEGDENE